MPDKQWYFRGSDGTIYGPLSGVDLREQARSGWVWPGSFVTNDTTDKWVVASQVKGLFPEGGGEPGPSASTTPLGHRQESTTHRESAPNNVFAIASLVSGALGYVIAPVIGAAMAIITWHVALQQIERSQGRENGKIMAVIGLILGYLQAVLLLASVIAFMVLGISIAAFVGHFIRALGMGGPPQPRPLPINPPPIMRPGAFGPFPNPQPKFDRLPNVPGPGALAGQGDPAEEAIPGPTLDNGPDLTRLGQAFELQGSWDVTGPRLPVPYVIEFAANRSVIVRHQFGKSMIAPWSYKNNIIHFGGSIQINDLKVQGPWTTRLRGGDEFEAVAPDDQQLTLKRRRPVRPIAL